MIRLNKSDLEAITSHLEGAYPHEGCGLLVGAQNDGVTAVSRVVLAENRRTTDAATRFEVDAKLQFDLMRELDGTGEKIVGHFHSHPDGKAVPSDRDRKMALDKEMIWLIAAVTDGKAGDIKAYAVAEEEKSFHPVRLEVG